MKTAIKIICMAAAALVLFAGCGSSSTDQANPVQAVRDMHDSYKPAMTSADKEITLLGKELLRLEKGEITTRDVMPALDNVIDECTEAEAAAKALTIPKGLPEGAANMCRLYIEQAGGIYSKRRQALESLASYLKDRQPEDLNRYKKLMGESMQHTTNMKHCLSKALKKAKAANS